MLLVLNVGSSSLKAALIDGSLHLDDQTGLIANALKTPGHTIAVAPLRTLLAQGGVLDQLRAKGYEVKTPGDED